MELCWQYDGVVPQAMVGERDQERTSTPRSTVVVNVEVIANKPSTELSCPPNCQLCERSSRHGWPTTDQTSGLTAKLPNVVAAATAEVSWKRITACRASVVLREPALDTLIVEEKR